MNTRRVKRYDRFWDGPEVTARVVPLLRSDERGGFLCLVEAGDPQPIREWLARVDPPVAVREAVEASLPPQDGYPALFDEIAVGRVCYHDGAGTIDWVLTRRVGKRFLHRVYFDGSGTVMSEWETPRPLTRREFEGLARDRPWLERDPEFGEGCAFSIESIWDG